MNNNGKGDGNNGRFPSKNNESNKEFFILAELNE
jgi:hypothetical protein